MNTYFIDKRKHSGDHQKEQQALCVALGNIHDFFHDIQGQHMGHIDGHGERPGKRKRFLPRFVGGEILGESECKGDCYRIQCNNDQSTPAIGIDWLFTGLSGKPKTGRETENRNSRAAHFCKIRIGIEAQFFIDQVCHRAADHTRQCTE